MPKKGDWGATTCIEELAGGVAAYGEEFTRGTVACAKVLLCGATTWDEPIWNRSGCEGTSGFMGKRLYADSGKRM